MLVRIVVLAALIVVSTVRAEASEICGDATNDGQVTVSDGVVMLRAAAGLDSTACPRSRCDMDLDGHITVTDGVRALRIAAELDPVQQATCSVSEANGVNDRLEGIFGPISTVTHSTGATATAADTTKPCPDGGSTTEHVDGFTDTACHEGDIITNGTVSVVSSNGTTQFHVTFVDFTSTRISTGETLATQGDIDVAKQGIDFVLDGTLHRSSNLLGTFDDTYTNVLAHSDGQLLSGALSTTIINGSGAYANLRSIRIQRFPSLTAIVDVTYADADPDEFVTAQNGGLCQSCGATDPCPTGLECVPCDTNCDSMNRHRCAPPEFKIVCSDGQY